MRIGNFAPHQEKINTLEFIKVKKHLINIIRKKGGPWLRNKYL